MTYEQAVNAFRKQLLTNAWARCRRNRMKAAAYLGMSTQRFYYCWRVYVENA